MNEEQKLQLRVEALSQAVRVSLANGGNESTETTVSRAKAYSDFLRESGS